jgi:hypothetical protein
LKLIHQGNENNLTINDIILNFLSTKEKVKINKFPLFDFDANVRATLKSLIHFNYKKYIYISSIDVYHPSIYGIHKSIAEFMLHQYSSLLHLSVLSILFFINSLQSIS